VSANERDSYTLERRAGAEEPPSNDDGVKRSQSERASAECQAIEGEGEKGEAWGLSRA
jgi:hypothetical protein